MILKTFLLAIAQILQLVIFAYTWVIIIGAVLSFVRPDPYNKLVQVIYRLTEPVYQYIRKYIPTTFGGLDFAPLIVLLGLQFLDKFLVTLVLRYASTM
ncbi:YggT family protein [Campylobacter geochelonis]|uniref:Yggt family protein n=1 Tax=Campylobacter geochelonis TaxID=1780362 RepID=A0A128EM03_9BACT|nr:YggT family protein [Campylobacter geochelonis]QKF71658.1 YggT family membrane protein [Campylobacter geochelonis]CZE49293.1 yggt family protein [Campylobacter geochelonis]CZE49403.1 yggt family protein [Campylobacter geochelonis]CZE51489.1 yggt family protein [Campylobacter geochelonis]